MPFNWNFLLTPEYTDIKAPIHQLRRKLRADVIIDDVASLSAYEGDAYALSHQKPQWVFLPRTEADVIEIVRYCWENAIPLTPRGAGTSLCGCVVPEEGGAVIALTRMNAITEICPQTRTATVEAGVTNAAISRAAASYGLMYAPDPSSQPVSTIAGNIACNAGGAHCLKYGVTANHIVGLEAILMTGEKISLGGKGQALGFTDNLTNLLIGSEGQIAIVTKATVALVPKPQTTRAALVGFGATRDAAKAVSEIIANNIIPVAIEFMDQQIVEIVEKDVKAGYPTDAAATLVIEVEGDETECEDELKAIGEIVRPWATTLKIAGTQEENQAIWKGRKSAFGAMGKIADYICMDGVIPLSKLPQAIEKTEEISKSHGLKVVNIFHAGDGNLHPVILYEKNNTAEMKRAEACGLEILKYCVDLGGSISGEHGIGLEKRDIMSAQFTQRELHHMRAIKSALDTKGLLNPSKVFPAQQGIMSPTQEGAHPKWATAEDNARIAHWRDTLATAKAQGHSCRMVTGETKRQGDLSLKDHVGIIAYAPEDRTLHVRSGTPIRQMMEALDAEGQMLPFEPMAIASITSLSAQETPASILAWDNAGPARLSNGNVRDNLLSVGALDAEGHVVRFGRPVMKDVAGYDLTKMLVGHRGGEMLITDVVFKTCPKPECQMTLCLDNKDLKQALEQTARLQGLATSPQAISMICNSEKKLWQTYLRIEGREQKVIRQVKKLESEFASQHIRVECVTEIASHGIWKSIQTLEPVLFPIKGGVWRVMAQTKTTQHIAETLLKTAPQTRMMLDWGGQVLWLNTPMVTANMTTLLSGVIQYGETALCLRRNEEKERRAGTDQATPDAADAVIITRQTKAVAKASEHIRRALDPDQRITVMGQVINCDGEGA